MSNPISVFKPTQDDWHPSHQLAGWYKSKKGIRLVEISIVELSGNGWRVCVWGADDYGLELNFESSREGAAFEIFQAVIEQEYVDKEWLFDQGFIRA